MWLLAAGGGSVVLVVKTHCVVVDRFNLAATTRLVLAEDTR